MSKGTELLYQDISNEKLEFNGLIDGLETEILSEVRDNGKYIEVKIDGVKYTTNQPGVNIVVYDTELYRVMDNISLDIETGKISRQ